MMMLDVQYLLTAHLKFLDRHPHSDPADLLNISYPKAKPKYNIHLDKTVNYT